MADELGQVVLLVSKASFVPTPALSWQAGQMAASGRPLPKEMHDSEPRVMLKEVWKNLLGARFLSPGGDHANRAGTMGISSLSGSSLSSKVGNEYLLSY